MYPCFLFSMLKKTLEIDNSLRKLDKYGKRLPSEGEEILRRAKDEGTEGRRNKWHQHIPGIPGSRRGREFN